MYIDREVNEPGGGAVAHSLDCEKRALAVVREDSKTTVCISEPREAIIVLVALENLTVERLASVTRESSRQQDFFQWTQFGQGARRLSLFSFAHEMPSLSAS